MVEHVVQSASMQDTVAFGRGLGREFLGGEVLLLRGPIGAGKSVAARGVGVGLGVQRWKGSPTFTLVNEYRGRLELFHADLYRLSAPEVEELGFEEYVRPDSVLVVEWPERAWHYLLELPATNFLLVDMEFVGSTDRILTVQWMQASHHVRGAVE